jgi:hypothetical protein
VQVRIPADLLGLIDSWATFQGVNRAEAMRLLLRSGYIREAQLSGLVVLAPQPGRPPVD